MHPIKSIIARNQTRIYNNFDKSSYGKKLKQFKDIHKGEICFIIGNGPSLKIEDLTKLNKLNIPTFAFNRVFCAFDETPWRPTYYISQDENVTYGMEEKFKKLDLPYRFHPIRWKWYKNINIPGAYYFKTVDSETKYFGFSEDISALVNDSPTVAYTGFQIAYYMGFRKMYMIGFDQTYRAIKDENGNIVTNDKVKSDYFSDKYRNDETDNLIIPAVFEMNRAFLSVDYHIKSGDIDMEVYNATRGGALEVFPRVNLDEIFKELEVKKNENSSCCTG